MEKNIEIEVKETREERFIEICKELANLSRRPYAWEDFYNRLMTGSNLPFEFQNYLNYKK
ncbi:MAG: hypothetical protein PVH88_02005 [Ignavibacteria bacterium]|jgi:hypothetical protein